MFYTYIYIYKYIYIHIFTYLYRQREPPAEIRADIGSRGREEEKRQRVRVIISAWWSCANIVATRVGSNQKATIKNEKETKSNLHLNLQWGPLKSPWCDLRVFTIAGVGRLLLLAQLLVCYSFLLTIINSTNKGAKGQKDGRAVRRVDKWTEGDRQIDR